MTKADRINFEKTMLAAFAKLVTLHFFLRSPTFILTLLSPQLQVEDPAYGGAVNSLTPNEDWAEVTGEAANPNLISPEKYQELVDAHVMFKAIPPPTRGSVAPSVAF